MKNNAVIIILIIGIGLICGVGFLLGVNNAVSVATVPIYQKVSDIESKQGILSTKISEINEKISQIDAKISELSKHLGAARPAQPAPPAEDPNKVYDIPQGKSIVVGKADAPITIVEFMDLQCPYCNRFHPMVKYALDTYPDKVKLMIKHYPLPFHPNALPGALVALAANEQGKFNQMVELLLANGADVSDAKLKEYAEALKIDLKKLTDDLKNNDVAYKDIISDDMRLADSVDVRGTPTYFINGKKTRARSPEAIKAEIENLLAQK